MVRIRLSSIEPTDIGSDLLEEISDHPRLCRHLHIPLQSGDDHILQAMNRGYSAQEYRDLIAAIRKVWPEVALTTDVMVGFPGESEEAFANTCRLIEEIGFSRLHVFRYSPRPQTTAANLPGQVSEEVKGQRSQELHVLGQKMFARFAERFIGEPVQVLFEQRNPDTKAWEGLTEHYLRVLVQADGDLLGELVWVRPKSVSGDHLLGSVTN